METDVVFNLVAQSKNFSGVLSGVTAEAKKFDSTMLKAGGALTALVSIPLAKTFGDIVNVGRDYEKQMSSIKALTGATAEEMKKYDALVIEAGASTAFSAVEAGQGLEELSKAGVSTSDILNGALYDSLDLAVAGDLELADAAGVASIALNAFKKDNMSVADAGNILAGAANASATEVGELSQGLSMVSAVAAGLNVSFKDTNTALAVFAQNGLKGSDAGTSLKTMLLNLNPMTKKAKEQFKALGIITADNKNLFYDSSGSLKSLAEVSQILQDKTKHLTDAQKQMALKIMFGTDAIRAANIMANEGGDGFNYMVQEMDKVKMADVAAEKMNNLAGAQEELSGSLETAGIEIYKMVAGPLTSLVKFGDKVVGMFNELPEGGKQAVVAAAGFAMIIPPISFAQKAITMFRAASISATQAVSRNTVAERINAAALKQNAASQTIAATAQAKNTQATVMTTAAKNRNSAIVATNVAAAKMESRALSLSSISQQQYARGAVTAGAATKAQSMALSAGATVANKSAMALGTAASGATKLAAGVYSFLGPVGLAMVAVSALTFGITKWKEAQAKAVEGAHEAADTLQGRMDEAITKSEERYAEAATNISGSLEKISQQQALVGTGVKGFTDKTLSTTIIGEYKSITKELKSTLDKQLEDEITYIQNRKTLSNEDKKTQIKNATEQHDARVKQATANQSAIDKISKKIRDNGGKATKEDIKELESYVEKAKELAKQITPDAEGKLDKYTSKGQTGGKMSENDRKAFHKALEETYGKELALIEQNTVARQQNAKTEQERNTIALEGAKEQAASLDGMYDKIMKANGAEKENLQLYRDENGLLQTHHKMTTEQRQGLKEYNEYLKTVSPEARKAWGDMFAEQMFDWDTEKYTMKGQDVTSAYTAGIKDGAAELPEIRETLKSSIDAGFTFDGNQIFYKGVNVTTSYMDGIKSKSPKDAIDFIKKQVEDDNMVVDKTGEGGETVKTYTGGIDKKSGSVKTSAQSAANKAKGAKAPSLAIEGAKIPTTLSSGINKKSGSVKTSAQSAANKAKGAKAPDMSGIGSAIPEGIAVGITNAAGSVSSAISALVGKIPAKIRKMLGINSPAKKLIPTGEAIPEGMGVGIMNATPAAVKMGQVSAAAIVAGIQTTLKKALSSAGLTNVIGTNYIKMLKNAQAAALKGVTDPEQIKAIQDYWGKHIKEAERENSRNVELAKIDDNYQGQLTKQDNALKKYTSDQNKAQKKALANSKKLKSLKAKLNKKGLTASQRKKINADIKKEEDRIKKIYQDRIKAKEKQIEANKKLIQQRYDLAKANAQNKHEVEDLNEQMRKELEELENQGIESSINTMKASYLSGKGGQTGGTENTNNIEQILFEINSDDPEKVGEVVLDKLSELLGNKIKNGVNYR